MWSPGASLSGEVSSRQHGLPRTKRLSLSAATHWYSPEQTSPPCYRGGDPSVFFEYGIGRDANVRRGTELKTLSRGASPELPSPPIRGLSRGCRPPFLRGLQAYGLPPPWIPRSGYNGLQGPRGSRPVSSSPQDPGGPTTRNARRPTRLLKQTGWRPASSVSAPCRGSSTFGR